MSGTALVAWVSRLVAAAGVLVVTWVCVTAGPAVVHGHPAYGVLLALTLLVFGAVGLASARRRPIRVPWWRALLRGLLLVLAAACLGAVAWLRPFAAQEPALSAMASDGAVRVHESATQITFTPAGPSRRPGLFFQPGARVDARAYAAVLRPLAVAGHRVVIAKQPLGMAFLAGGAFEKARAARPDVATWVVGGHSLGGVVAASEAAAHGTDAGGGVSGLVLYASYPASDLSRTLSCPVLSVSGSADGLATPDDIARSRADLPAEATFTVVRGGVHAFFGDYGPQPGDGTPSVPRDDARRQITAATAALIDAASRGDGG